MQCSCARSFVCLCSQLCLHGNHSGSRFTMPSIEAKLRLGAIKLFQVIHHCALEQASLPTFMSGSLATYRNRKKNKIQNCCVYALLTLLLMTPFFLCSRFAHAFHSIKIMFLVPWWSASQCVPLFSEYVAQKIFPCLL